jgi:hypothetical protein
VFIAPAIASLHYGWTNTQKILLALRAHCERDARDPNIDFARQFVVEAALQSKTSPRKKGASHFS